MIMALRDKEMKLVMMNESKVYTNVSSVSHFTAKAAYASTCNSRICLDRIRDGRAVVGRVKHCCTWYQEPAWTERWSLALGTRVKGALRSLIQQKLKRMNVTECDRDDHTASL